MTWRNENLPKQRDGLFFVLSNDKNKDSTEAVKATREARGLPFQYSKVLSKGIGEQ